MSAETMRQELYRLYAQHAELTKKREELARLATDLEWEAIDIAKCIADLEEGIAKEENE